MCNLRTLGLKSKQRNKTDSYLLILAILHNKYQEKMLISVFSMTSKHVLEYSYCKNIPNILMLFEGRVTCS